MKQELENAKENEEDIIFIEDNVRVTISNGSFSRRTQINTNYYYSEEYLNSIKKEPIYGNINDTQVQKKNKPKKSTKPIERRESKRLKTKNF